MNTEEKLAKLDGFCEAVPRVNTVLLTRVKIR